MSTEAHLDIAYNPTTATKFFSIFLSSVEKSTTTLLPPLPHPPPLLPPLSPVGTAFGREISL